VLTGIESVVERARSHDPEWRLLTMQLSPADGGVSFSIDRGDGGQPQKRAQLVLDASTGAVLMWEPFPASSPGRRARSILRFAHTGEVLGVPGQTIAGLVSAGAVVLVWTGLALSLRRLVAWLRRRTAVRTEAAPGATQRRAA
jgi:uncharacterized iron-regulated membrane protein